MIHSDDLQHEVTRNKQSGQINDPFHVPGYKYTRCRPPPIPKPSPPGADTPTRANPLFSPPSFPSSGCMSAAPSTHGKEASRPNTKPKARPHPSPTSYTAVEAVERLSFLISSPTARQAWQRTTKLESPRHALYRSACPPAPTDDPKKYKEKVHQEIKVREMMVRSDVRNGNFSPSSPFEPGDAIVGNLDFMDEPPSGARGGGGQL